MTSFYSSRGYNKVPDSVCINRTWYDPLVSSHYGFVIPIYICWLHSHYEGIILVLFLFPFSIAYHWSHERRFVLPELIAAHLVLPVSSLYYLQYFSAFLPASAPVGEFIPFWVFACETTMLVTLPLLYWYISRNLHLYDRLHLIIHVFCVLYTIFLALFHYPIFLFREEKL